MKFQQVNEPIAGLKLIKRDLANDKRGQFSRLFCADALSDFGWPNEIAQSNFSKTNNVGAIRGLHFQRPPHAEAKLVTCVSGSVFDVAVDLRKGSTAFGRWFGHELSEENGLSLLIPQGFAHGFQVLRSQSMMVYYHSHPYAPDAEGGIKWDDETLKIDWPLPVSGISERDQHLPSLVQIGEGLSL